MRTATVSFGHQQSKQRPRSEGRSGPDERVSYPQVDEAVGLIAERDAGLAQRVVPVAAAVGVGALGTVVGGQQEHRLVEDTERLETVEEHAEPVVRVPQ